MSSSAEAYREAESLCASKFYYEKRKVVSKKSAALGKALDLVYDEQISDVIDVEKSAKKDRAMKKSHLRCVNEKYYVCKIHKLVPKNQI